MTRPQSYSTIAGALGIALLAGCASTGPIEPPKVTVSDVTIDYFTAADARFTVQVNLGTAEAPHVVTFPEARYTLIHDARPPTQLVPAQIAEAVGDVIDPDAVPEGGATVLIAANSHIAPGVRLLFWMRGEDPNGEYVGYTDGLYVEEPVTFPVTFFIPRDLIVRLAGGTANIVYELEIPYDEVTLAAPERVYDIGLGASGQRSSS